MEWIANMARCGALMFVLPGISALAQEAGYALDGGLLELNSGKVEGYGLEMPALEFADSTAVAKEFDLNVFRLSLSARSYKPHFVFDRNPYSYDYSGNAVVKGWDTGYVYAGASHTTFPGLMAVETGSFSVTQDFGKVTLSGSVTAEKYRTFRGLDTNYGVSGMLTYRVDERLSFNVFGQYYRKSLYYSPAMLPYIGTSKYGVFADMQFGERFGMDLGVSREYDAYSRRWQTVPIAAPYVKLNNGAKIGLDVGRLLGVMIDEWVNDGRYYNSGNPTIGPPIPPMPPVR